VNQTSKFKNIVFWKPQFILGLALILVLVLPFFFSLAEVQDPVLERQQLEQELKKLEEEIARYDKDIQKTEAEKKTLQNKISILKNTIRKLDLQIQQSSLVVKDLTFQIKDTESSISKTALKIEELKQHLAGTLQLIYEEDQRPVVEILLSEDSLAGFFANLAALEAINSKSRELLENIKTLKSYLEDQKQNLGEEKSKLERQIMIQTLQKQESSRTKEQQEYFLKFTEQEYQKYLSQKQETQKKAQEIRSRIFELIGVPKAPTFGEAYEIAKFVSETTDIRPALLLAVLTQESNIGRNVGQCFLTDTETGEGVRSKTGEKESRVMKPERDIPHFLAITSELGRDFRNTLVSCPLKDSRGRPVGWGGAMGPSQFIPSTWVLYKDAVSAVTGKPADPWKIKDAFLATGIYLKDLGGTSDEFTAVMRYFSGYRWSKWEEFYGRSVMAIARQYESDIQQLNK
jgi:membrane-bound lytic murein transglycosylase B